MPTLQGREGDAAFLDGESYFRSAKKPVANADQSYPASPTGSTWQVAPRHRDPALALAAA